jgi:hypothetical protein
MDLGMARRTFASAEEAFQTLSREARPGCVPALTRIHHACRALIQNGDQRLRTRSVAQICETLSDDGPSEKTINNDHAGVYQAMIWAHRDAIRRVVPHHRRRRNRFADVTDLFARARLACLDKRIQQQERLLRRCRASHARVCRRR